MYKIIAVVHKMLTMSTENKFCFFSPSYLRCNIIMRSQVSDVYNIKALGITMAQGKA